MSLYEQTGAVTTRFRDVPFDEVRGCHTPGDEEDQRQWEEECRGQSIDIFVPPVPEELVTEGYSYFDSGCFYSVGPAPSCPSGCRGPFYKLIDFEGTVCEHLVEIGD